jgi:large subunit ribosomal protein L17
MKHRVKTKQLGRDTNARKGLLRSLVRELVINGEITTTAAKAKEAKRLADKLIARAQDGTIASRRQLHTFFGKRDVVNTLIDRVAPAFTERTSGFTRISSVGIRRGDNAQMVKLELVEKPATTGTVKNPEPKKQPARKTATRAASKKAVAGAKKTIARKPAAKAKPTKTKA